MSGRIPVEDTATTSQFHEDNLSSDEENEEFTSLFVCPEDGCVKKILTHGKLDQHVMYGKHQFKLERLTLLDRAKISYAQHLEAGSQTVITVSAIPAQSTMDKEKGPKPLSKGWALKESEKKHRRFNKKQKQYMDKKFDEGEKTGIKSSGEEVSKEMRYVRDASGRRIFNFDEYLRPQQITSYFSRTAAKRRKVTVLDHEAQTNQDNHERLCKDVLEAVREKTLKHPVIFSRRNLCLTIVNGMRHGLETAVTKLTAVTK